MVTQRAELSSMIMPASTENVVKQSSSLTGNFQSYINGNTNTGKNAASGINQESKMKTEYSQKDAYDKVNSETYSKNIDQMKSQMRDTETTEAEQSNEVNGLTTETVDKIEQEIRDVIKEKMGMTDEEIDEILEIMNISIFQLLQPEMLQEFVMTQTGSEPIDMLTNSELLDTIGMMSQEMTDILQEFDVNDVPEFVEQLIDFNSAEETDLLANSGSVEQEEIVSDNTDSELVSKSEPKETREKDDDSMIHQEDDEVTVKEESTGIQVTVKNADTKKEQTNHQALGEQGQQFAGNVVNQLTEAVGEATQTVTSYTSELEKQDIVRQVVDQIKLMNGNETTRMQVQLYPEHLGRVEIQVLLKNGTMTAQITAETEMAKAAIESQLQLLKESFEEKNIQVDAVDVSVGTKNFDRDHDKNDSGDDKNESRTRSRSALYNGSDTGMDDLAEEAEEQLEARGASVEFSA